MSSLLDSANRIANNKLVQQMARKGRDVWRDAQDKNVSFLKEAKSRAQQSLGDLDFDTDKALKQAKKAGRKALSYAQRNPKYAAFIVAGAAVAVTLAIVSALRSEKPAAPVNDFAEEDED